MPTDGNDPRGRGRRLFGSRRRAAEPAERPAEVSSEPAPPADAATGAQADASAETPPPTPGTARPSPEPPSWRYTAPPAPTPAEPTPAPPATTPAPRPAPTTTNEDGWTVEPGANTESAAGTAADIVHAPDPEGAPATSSSEPGDVPADAHESPSAALAPAEGGHVSPPAERAPAGGRAGSVGIPGSAERSRSVDEAEGEAGDSDDEPLAYELPRIVAIANQKGGVGKTTTSVNLGASLAELGYRVLVVDLDPQGNATTGLGINARNLQASVYDVIMTNAAIEDCVEPTSLKNLFVAPATIDLAGAEIELVPAFSRELKLRRALEEVRDEYDYVLIDCPPSLGLLTVNGLAAADDVIVPIQCEYYALEGLSQLIRNVTLVRTNLNPKLDVRGIVLTMYDARTKLADQVEQEVREHFGRRVYQTVVPRTVRLSEAPSFGQPIIVFDSTSRGAVAYRELAKEVSSGASRRAG
jgi:chromosome partitioning protein